MFQADMLKYCIIISLIFVSVLQIAHAEETVNLLDKYLDGLDNVQANFKQTLLNENGIEIETSSGIVYMQRPGKFRWDYKEPYTQMIITDGQTLWLYDEDLEQVTIRDISKSIEDTPAAILSGQENINEVFVIVDMGDIEGFWWIELTPRDIENQYSSVRLGFDKNDLGMMILFDNLGQVTRIDFSETQRNGELDNTLFTFDPPAGIDVIDDRGLTEK